MGSIYRKTPGAKKWHVAWTDENGRRRVRAAFPDRRMSARLLADLERAVHERRSGMVDPFEGHRAKALTTHVDAFAAILESRGCTDAHVRTTCRRLRRAFASMGAEKIDGLDSDGAARFVARLRASGKADATCNAWILALRGFGKWLVESGRAPSNPFHLLKRPAGEPDPRRQRLPLTWEQVDELVRSTRPWSLNRAVLYLFAALTGLRANECRNVMWTDLQLGGEDPCVTVRSRWAKNRRTAEVPLARVLVDALRELFNDTFGLGYRVEVPRKLVFRVPTRLASWVRSDAVQAGLPTRDGAGRLLDFHSLRVSTGTILARAGVPPAVAQRILRHHDPKLTMKHYTKLALADLTRAVNSIAPVAEKEAGSAPSRKSPQPVVEKDVAPLPRRAIGSVRGLNLDRVGTSKPATSTDKEHDE